MRSPTKIDKNRKDYANKRFVFSKQIWLLVLLCISVVILSCSPFSFKSKRTTDKASPRRTQWLQTQSQPLQQLQQTCNASKYHVLMTAQPNAYLNWQALISYYHYKKQKSSSPCNDLGGFTRLVSGR